MMQIMPPGGLKLGVMASGRGSNFDAIHAAIARGDLLADIAIVISDNQEAAVLKKAINRGIAVQYVDPSAFTSRNAYEEHLISILQDYKVNLVALAGYMRLVGSVFLGAYRHRVLNIHPALLPSFTGLHAQAQAVAYGVRFSGCTVHLVDEGMDTGPIIMQRVVQVDQDDDEDSLAARILEQEHDIYWRSLQLFAEGRIWLEGRRIFIR